MIKSTFIAEPRKQYAEMLCIFDAPKELVYKVYTDPKLIKQWWMSKEFPVTVDKMDVKFGGSWRFVMHTPEKKEIIFRGVYHTVIPNEMLVMTFEFDSTPVMLDVVSFDGRNGKTKLTDKAIFQSVGDRDAVLPAMKKESPEVMNRIAEVLKKIKK